MNNKYIFLLIGVVVIGFYIYFTRFQTPSSEPSSSQQLTIKGSDTEVQLVSNLAEAFSISNPESIISVTGGGSGVGIASLLNKEIDLANSSRKIEDKELEEAKKRGLDVQEFLLARDGLSIVLHPNNTVAMLTTEQLGKIYKGEITNWKDVGGNDNAIVLYGRQSTSGTYVFFRDAVVKADYAPGMRSMEGSQAIVDAVASDIFGIGYVGVGYVKGEDGNVRTDITVIPIAKDKDTEPVSPLDSVRVKKGEYPISRLIYQYLPYVPSKGSDLEKFLRYEASAIGQETVEKAGFYSLTESDVQQNDTFFAKMQ